MVGFHRQLPIAYVEPNSFGLPRQDSSPEHVGATEGIERQDSLKLSYCTRVTLLPTHVINGSRL